MIAEPRLVDTHGLRFVVATGPAAPPWDGVDAVVELHSRPHVDAVQGMRVSDDVAEAVLPGVSLRVARGTPHRVVIASGHALDDDALRHPYLSFPAAIIHHWADRLVLHASAFDVEAGAVALLGDKEAGKSTTVAAAGRLGHPVRADDVLVVDGTRALVGSRTLDLREEAAAIFGGTPLGVVGSRERFRQETSPPARPAPLAAFVVLEWGPGPELQRLEASELLRQLHRSTALAALIPRQMAHRPQVFLDLLGVPAYRLIRPRDVSAAVEVVQELVAALGGGR